LNESWQKNNKRREGEGGLRDTAVEAGKKGDSVIKKRSGYYGLS